MIQSYDRAYWIGASDTKYVMNDNRSTKTWLSWWNVKIGIEENLFTGNIFTRMGTLYEHPILDALDPNIRKDLQLKIPKYNLRVNYDGDLDGWIYEVKTHREDKPLDIGVGSIYYNQCQVEMFGYKQYLKESAVYYDWHTREHLPEFKGLYIVDYPLKVDEYSKLEIMEQGGMPVLIDKSRIKLHRIKYNKGFVSDYKSRVKFLAKRIRDGRVPF